MLGSPGRVKHTIWTQFASLHRHLGNPLGLGFLGKNAKGAAQGTEWSPPSLAREGVSLTE